VLSDGMTLPYDQLLITTGARPRRLSIEGGTLPAVHYLRTLDDAIALKQSLKSGTHVAVVGGGFIGLEIASAATTLGCTVDVLEASPRLCHRALHPRAAMHLHQYAEQAGVRVQTNAQVESIHMVDAKAQLSIDSGEPIKADVVVVGIGVVANSELAESAGLVVEGGIWVNEYGQTSDASVYAAGDVALWPHQKEPLVRLESWQNAQEQAIAAATSMVSKPHAYDVVPWFWTDQFGHNVQMLGLPSPTDHYEWVAHAGGGTYYFHDETRLTGVVALDDAAAIKKARQWLALGLSADALRQAIQGSNNNHEIIASTGNHGSTEMTNLAQYFVWPEEGLRRIPDWVYTDPVIYQMEVEKIFHGPNWNYVGLEAEIPEPGDFIRSYVGPTAVIVSRDEEGEIHVFMNRCSHRAAEFCRELRGNNKEFVCPYHQWTYDLKGNLSGIPFRRGVGGKGGLPKDFDRAAHNPTQLQVTTRNGVIFASFSDQAPALEDYLGPRLLEEFDATFDGRQLKVLGYYRNTVPGNWKLYHENLKDPYHATLLHTFLVSFGLLVAGNKAEMICDETGRHGVMASAKSDAGKVSEEDSKEMRAYKPDFQLQDPSMLDFVEEFDSPWSVTMMTFWPNLIVQREMNTLGVRQIVPQGPNEFVMNWTMFGFEGDSEETLKHRMRQGNLMGPAGFLGLEDNEAMKFVQDGMKRSMPGQHLIEMDPNTEVGTADNLISESAIRAMYQYWRKELGIS
jgi:anthranilate 1,2-dioxygenase large subunit